MPNLNSRVKNQPIHQEFNNLRLYQLVEADLDGPFNKILMNLFPKLEFRMSIHIIEFRFISKFNVFFLSNLMNFIGFMKFYKDFYHFLLILGL